MIEPIHIHQISLVNLSKSLTALARSKRSPHSFTRARSGDEARQQKSTVKKRITMADSMFVLDHGQQAKLNRKQSKRNVVEGVSLVS
jgi:hypothetical protein